jgi:hypothetical protein
MNHECIQGQRITALETQEAIMGIKLDNLIDALKTLNNRLMVFSTIVLSGMIGALGYLIIKWVEK